MVSHPMVLLDGQHILSRMHAVVLEPLRVHIEAARRLAHDFYVQFLPLFSQQPINKNFRRVRMRWIFDDTDYAGTVARWRALFYLGKFFNRQVGDQKTLEGVKADTESDGEFAFSQRIGQL